MVIAARSRRMRHFGRDESDMLGKEIARVHHRAPLSEIAFARRALAKPRASSTRLLGVVLTTTSLVAGCSTVLGADFDRSADPKAQAAVTCTTGWSDCNDDPADGCETDTGADPKSCGACGKACGAGLVCGNATCLSACPSGTRSCEGACRAESATSCGSACAVCPVPAHGSAVCSPSGCAVACRAGYAASGASCVDATPSNTWTTTQAAMPTARMGMSAVTVDGNVYVIGGRVDPASAQKTTAVVEVYTPSTNSWSQAADMPTSRTFAGATVSADGRIFVIGGFDFTSGALSSNEVYTPTTNTWTTEPNMPTQRESFDAVTGADGRIFVFGGLSKDKEPLEIVEAYDPSSRSWARVADMPTARAWVATARASDGRIFVIGGATSATPEGDVSTVEVYTPGTNSWSTAEPLPSKRGSLAAVSATDGRIFAFGGVGNRAALARVEAYTPATNTWNAVAAMPRARAELAAAAVGERIFLFGGYAGAESFTSVDAYKP